VVTLIAKREFREAVKDYSYREIRSARRPAWDIKARQLPVFDDGPRQE
jgi:hypothetical protein